MNQFYSRWCLEVTYGLPKPEVVVLWEDFVKPQYLFGNFGHEPVVELETLKM